MDVKKTNMSSMLGKWLRLSKFNTFVKDTSIFPSKSPHNKFYANILKNDETFYLTELKQHLEKQNRPLKCILDLSEGTHYLSKDIKALEIDYRKVKIKGKSIPSENDLIEIFDIISKFDSKNEYSLPI